MGCFWNSNTFRNRKKGLTNIKIFFLSPQDTQDIPKKILWWYNKNSDLWNFFRGGGTRLDFDHIPKFLQVKTIWIWYNPLVSKCEKLSSTHFSFHRTWLNCRISTNFFWMNVHGLKQVSRCTYCTSMSHKKFLDCFETHV